jgi:hypothetical protein
MLFPQPTSQKQEHWLRFKAEGPAEGEIRAGNDVVVVSGYAYYSEAQLLGNATSDSIPENHECHLKVGPKWELVNGVSPIVSVSGWTHFDSDDADATGYRVDDCKWDFPGGPGSQIRLRVFIDARGGLLFSIRGLAYHLVARGQLMLQEQDFADHKGGV